MTVKELIAELQKMPEDLEVLYTQDRHMNYHVAGIDKVDIFRDNDFFVIIGDFK